MWLAADAVAQHRAGRSGAADREGSGAGGGAQAAQQRRADKGKAPAAAVDTDMQTGGATRKEKLLGAKKGKCADKGKASAVVVDADIQTGGATRKKKLLGNGLPSWDHLWALKGRAPVERSRC